MPRNRRKHEPFPSRRGCRSCPETEEPGTSGSRTPLQPPMGRLPGISAHEPTYARQASCGRERRTFARTVVMIAPLNRLLNPDERGDRSLPQTNLYCAQRPRDAEVEESASVLFSASPRELIWFRPKAGLGSMGIDSCDG